MIFVAVFHFVTDLRRICQGYARSRSYGCAITSFDFRRFRCLASEHVHACGPIARVTEQLVVTLWLSVQSNMLAIVVLSVHTPSERLVRCATCFSHSALASLLACLACAVQVLALSNIQQILPTISQGHDTRTVYRMTLSCACADQALTEQKISDQRGHSYELCKSTSRMTTLPSLRQVNTHSPM